MDFIRFMFCLGVGLVGLCMVLKTLLDTLFAEWDLAAEARVLMRRPEILKRAFRRHEDELIAEAAGLSTRMNPYQPQKRPVSDTEVLASR